MLYDRPNWAELYFDKKKMLNVFFFYFSFMKQRKPNDSAVSDTQWHFRRFQKPHHCASVAGPLVPLKPAMSEKNEWKVKNCEKQTACKERKYLFKVIRRKMCVPLPLFKLINLFITFSFVLLNFLLLCIFAQVPSKFPSISATVI